MSESHAADTPMDEERARREAEERREKIKQALETIASLEKHFVDAAQQRGFRLSREEADVLLWYITQLRSVCRTTDRVLYNQIYEMQQLKKNVVQLY